MSSEAIARSPLIDANSKKDPENANLVKDVLQMAEEMVANASVHRNNTRRPKRKTPAMLWKELQPGSKMWDAKMEYEAIGKEPDSHYDEVSWLETDMLVFAVQKAASQKLTPTRLSC